jgi:DNA-binding HxlR family transcriptional regulator
MNRTRRPVDLSHRFQGDSVSRTLALVGDHWTLMILREELFGVRRFGQRNLGIPRPTLSARLRSMVDSGLLERVLYARDPERHEYRLTDAGRELFAAAALLMRWGDKYLAGPEGRRSCCATTTAARSPTPPWYAATAVGR